MRHILLVAVGGAAGTALREAVALLLPSSPVFPVATLTVNLTGALLLGILLETLVRRGPDEGRRRDVRLLLGTGLLGGYTTYSALAMDTVLLADAGSAGTAVVYLLGTVVAGAVATWLGISGASLIARRRPGAAR